MHDPLLHATSQKLQSTDTGCSAVHSGVQNPNVLRHPQHSHFQTHLRRICAPSAPSSSTRALFQPRFLWQNMTTTAGRSSARQNFRSCKHHSVHVCKVHAARECCAWHVIHSPFGHALVHDHAAAGRSHEH